MTALKTPVRAWEAENGSKLHCKTPLHVTPVQGGQKFHTRSRTNGVPPSIAFYRCSLLPFSAFQARTGVCSSVTGHRPLPGENSLLPPKAGLTADGPCRGRRRLSIGAAGVTPSRMAPGGALCCLRTWLGGCPRINRKKWTAAGAAGRVVHRSLGVTRSTSGVRHHRRVNARGILCTAA